ncbi:MAG: hypothetical protein IT379_24250 [Deltaproteobacteria bacterium]|nr:hypothetical protein [Deltaproteobacteria bacterium]
MKAVYTVVERAQGKSFWVRIGAAFVNRDGSFTVKLDALPVNGMLQIRDPQPLRDGAGATPRGEDDIPF